MAQTIDIDELFPSSVLSGDRASLYRRLREEAPFQAISIRNTRGWIVSRYADVERILRDPTATIRPAHEPTPPWLEDGPAAALYRHQLLYVGAAEHLRLRRLVARAFSLGQLEKLRSKISLDISRRLETLAGRTQIDVISDLGDWIPATATCALLGIPHADWPALIAQMHDALPLFSALPLPVETVRRCDAAAGFFIAYFTALITERRAKPGDDVVTALLEAEEAGERLSRDELLSLMLAIFGGGYETSMTTTGNGVLALLQHPEQWRMLVDDPALAAAAVEEIVRWSPAVHITPRYLQSPARHGDVRIEPEDVILLAIGAANRDQTAIPGADRFSIRRSNNPHLAFGRGNHFCLGANLARLSLREVFAQLPKRFPHMGLIHDKVERRPDLTLPSLLGLDVRLRP